MHIFEHCIKEALRRKTILSVTHQLQESPMSFFDTNPTGRLMNLFSNNMDELDVSLPFHAENFLQQFQVFFILVKIAHFSFSANCSCYHSYYFWFFQCCRFFLRTIHELIRMKISRSPLLSHIVSSVQGLSIIHAYDRKDDSINQFYIKLNVHFCFHFRVKNLTNENAKHMLLFNCALFCFAVTTDILVSFLTLIVALFVVLSSPSVSAASKYLTLPYTIQLSGILQVCVRTGTETDSKFTSVEEIVEYAFGKTYL
ncbi:LOW QUALITY PROTEIN: ATP-binding cassette sub-family C member 12-like [Morphnus guianensis]